MFDFGLRIKELREQHKMSQEQLGRRIDRSKSVISSYENNIKIPPLDILTKIAVIFNVSLDYLVGIDKNEIDDFIYIQQELERISVTVEALQLWAEKMLANGIIDADQYNARKNK